MHLLEVSETSNPTNVFCNTFLTLRYQRISRKRHLIRRHRMGITRRRTAQATVVTKKSMPALQTIITVILTKH